MKAEGLNVKALKIAIIIFAVGCLYQRFHRPLPDEFSQPWKYRLICFGADLVINQMGRYLEAMGIVHRVNITRFSYHMAIGAFNIRDPSDGIQVLDETIDNNMAVRIYRPYNPDYEHSRIHQNTTDFLAPTILFYHGGGFFVGSADTLEPVTYLMAKYTNYTVIYIEFRLIPEHKFPAALNDSYSTTLHLLRHYRKYNIDPDRLILMGDSAGGNLATVIGQKLSVDNIVKPKLQVLIYPLLQMFDFTLPSYRANLPQRVLGNIDHETFKHFLHYLTGFEVDDSVFANGHTSQAHKESHLSSYVNMNLLPEEFRQSHEHMWGSRLLNDTEDKYAEMAKILLSSDVSPLLVSDDHLAKHTPHNTLLLTTGIDILRDDGFIYAQRLKSLGLSIEHRHYENLFHGVFGLLHGLIEFDVAHDLVKQVVDHVKQTVY